MSDEIVRVCMCVYTCVRVYMHTCMQAWRTATINHTSQVSRFRYGQNDVRKHGLVPRHVQAEMAIAFPTGTRGFNGCRGWRCTLAVEHLPSMY